MAVRAQEKQLELLCHVFPEVPDTLQGDPGRLRQIVVNLVGNAMKFTPRGEIEVRVTIETYTETEIVLHFAVRDTGIGIPADKQPAIFEPFTQADGSTTRTYGGTGLGLAIVSQLVSLMAGRLWVDSQVGQGSTFHFTAHFLVQPAAMLTPAVLQATTVQDMSVLVVDANLNSATILAEMLQSWRMQPMVVQTGEVALIALNEAQATGRPFALVLLDTNLQDLNSFMLVEQIRQISALQAVVVILLTSAGQRGDAARCRALGVAAYLTKPARPSDLLEAIVAAVGVSQGARTPAALITRHTLRESRKRLRILLAEDNLVNQKLAVSLLEKWGHTVAIASNGQEALTALTRQDFDLVLMDIQMPVMDGFEATAAIRAAEQTTGSHIPIVAMTANAMQGDRERCLAAGMDAYMAKPLRADEFFNIIEGLAPDVPATPASAAASRADEVFDRTAVLTYVEGDEALLAEILALFCLDMPPRMARLRDALHAAHLSAIEHEAHTIKGAARSIGAQGVQHIAGDIEEAARRQDVDAARTRYAQLTIALEQLWPSLGSNVYVPEQHVSPLPGWGAGKGV